MFERTAGQALLLATCVVSGAWGQDLPTLRRRADSLAIAWREARMLADLQDSLKRNAPPPNMERVQAGALTVLADPSDLPLERAARDAWTRIDAFYGPAALTLAGRPLALRVLTPGQTRAPGAGERWVLATDDLDAAELTQLLVRNAPLPPVDRALHGWLTTPLLPPGDGRRELSAVYVDLVTTPSVVGRDCFRGDLGACRVALSLTPATRPVLDWWNADDRRRLVPVLLESYFLADAARRTLTAACLQQGADSACIQLLESIPPAALPRPLGPLAQLTLTQLALERGGRGAYVRLLADSTAALSDRLVAAGGQPLDSMIAAWHAAVLASRPPRGTLPWLSALLVLGWTGVLATCALQSSRWRL